MYPSLPARTLLLGVLFGFLSVIACGRPQTSAHENLPISSQTAAGQTTRAAVSVPGAQSGNQRASVPALPHLVIPEGTHLPVRVNEELDTKRNRAGDGFLAVLEVLKPYHVG